MSKIVIFGSGQYYQRRKCCFEDENVVAILDNNKSIWGKKIDNVNVYAPEWITTLDYDAICIMAGHKYAQEMKEQLVSLGVPTECIYENHRAYFKEKKEKKVVCIGKSNMKNNKVIMFLPTFENTGGFRAAMYALEVLLKEYCGVTVISPCDGASRCEITARGADIIIASDVTLSNNILWELIRDAEIYFFNALYYGYLVAEVQGWKKKILWWLHTGESFYDVYPLPDVEFSNAIVMGVSNLVQRAYEMHSSGGKIGLLPFGIPDNKVEVTTNNRERLVFATVGSICRVKGIDVLIEAIKKITDIDRAKAEFWLIGYEAERIYADRLHKEAEQIPEIKWMGGYPHEKVLNMYADVDILISSSREDMLPIVTCEALMNEKVCIVSDAIGTAGFMTDGVNGLIFRSENADSLAEKITWCIRHKDNLSQLGSQGRKLYEKHFTIPVFADNLKKILKSDNN